MKIKLILLLIVFAVMASCNKKSSEIVRSNEDEPKVSSKATITNQPKSFEMRFIQDPDNVLYEIRSIYPELAIRTIDQLDEWIDTNGGVVIAYFKAGNAEPQFSLSKRLIEYLVVSIVDEDRKTYTLVGNTNSQGNQEANMTLSIQRSRATLELLLNNFNLGLSKLPALGEGETNPIEDNETSKGRKLNSRVELRKIR